MSYLKKAILHVLDNNSNILVLSNGELEVDGELSEYISKHIDKMIEDPNLKKAIFESEDNNFAQLCKKITEQNFISVTSEMVRDLYNLMQKHIDIPSADLICCLFEENRRMYFGIMKLNYKTGFTHWINNCESGNINTIIKHKTLLPQEGQKVDECVFVDLESYEIMLVEKQYEINGEKDFYLSNHFIKCVSEMSLNQKLKIMNNVAKKINKKYFEEDFEQAIQLKKAVSETLEENEILNIESVAQKVYKKNPDIQNEYIGEIAKAGLIEREISIPEKIVEKKFSVQKIKTDTGIEINFPLEYAENTDKIEFINNPDGTIAIVIKNVSKIVNK